MKQMFYGGVHPAEHKEATEQKPIQPLTGIILADGQFFHSFPSSSAKCLLIWSVNSWAAL